MKLTNPSIQFVFNIPTRPSLLSLDLSYNNLTDLQSTVEILKQLPVLRNLLLIGNPLHVSTMRLSVVPIVLWDDFL